MFAWLWSLITALWASLFTWSGLWGGLVTLVVLLLLGNANLTKKKDDKESQEEEEEEDTSGSTFGGESVRLKPEAPAGATGEIARILNAKDYFAVLDVPREADGAEVKKAKMSKMLIVHPDKNKDTVGAVEAAQRVNAASDTLSEDVARRQYQIRLEHEESGKSMGGASDLKAASQMFHEFCKEAMGPAPEGAHYPSVNPADYDPWNADPNHSFHMPCRCGFDHIAKKVPHRNSTRARKCCCQQCGFLGMGTLLTARHDDVWFESRSNLLRHLNPEYFIVAYRCVGTYVYDITDWCRCSGLLADAAGRPAPTNIHYVPFRLQSRPGDPGRKKAQKSQKGTGYNEFKGGGATSHKKNNNKKKGRLGRR